MLGSSAFCDRREIVYAAPEPVKVSGEAQACDSPVCGYS